MPVDNAAADTFFAALKNEMYYRESFATRARARFAVAAYIEVFYNRQRLHSTLSYRTPLKALTKFHTRTRRRSWPWTPARRPAVARLPSLRRHRPGRPPVLPGVGRMSERRAHGDAAPSTPDMEGCQAGSKPICGGRRS